MGQIRVTFTGASEAVAALSALGERLKLATERATGKAGDFYQTAARSHFSGVHLPGYPHIGGDSPNIASGRLQESILTSPVTQIGDGDYTVHIGPTTIYGRIIELGGTITPVEAKYLSWFSPWLNRRIYRKEVTLEGWAYMRPAWNDAVEHMNSIYEDEWTEAIGE